MTESPDRLQDLALDALDVECYADASMLLIRAAEHTTNRSDAHILRERARFAQLAWLHAPLITRYTH